MDGASGAATLITLVDLAIQVARETARLCHDFTDAPRQLQAVSARTTLLRKLLQDLASSRDELSLIETLSESCQDVLKQSLRCAWNTVIEIQRVRNKYCNTHKPGIRFQWALLGKRRSDLLLQSLKDVETELILAMSLVQCHTNVAVISSLSKIELTLAHQLDISHSLTGTAASDNPQSLTATAFKNCFTIQLKVSYTSAAYRFLRALGIEGCFYSYSSRNGRTDHVMFRIPFLWYRALVVEFGIKTNTAAGSGINIFKHHLSLRNVVPETSQIMIASRQGDLQTVQTLFENKSASPFDITKDGETPLELAVENGSTQLVSFLLQHCADPNTIVDESSGMSVLQHALLNRDTAIARLLLLWGACRWHADAKGWTNASYIWARRRDDGNRSQDCLSLLLSECCPSLTSYDAQNWTVLHRAASFGSLEDIQLLLNSGANPKATVNGWTPAFYAVCLKNFPAVLELAKTGLDINYQDGGGWTLLHLAAWTNSKSVLDCLFKLGADPHVKGISHEVYWKDFRGRKKPAVAFERCTSPLDLARSQGEGSLRQFVLAAQEAGLELELDADADIFWPAEEHLTSADG